MCEFCTEHGEGKVWYLQAKNYAREMLSERLSPDQRRITQAATRLEWHNRFWRHFIMPAVTGVPNRPGEQAFRADTLDEDKVEHFGQVLPIEDVEHVLDLVDTVTRLPCGCRFKTIGKTDKRYCFGFGVDVWGDMGALPPASASLEVLSKKDAKAIIRDFDKEGLMHSIWTGVTPYVVGVCNCDHDCGAYRAYLRGYQNFFRAEYVCRVDWDVCTGCKTCMSQCQFGAQFYSSALGKVYIDPARCFGCGVCRAACPHDAIALVERRREPAAAGLWLGAATT